MLAGGNRRLITPQWRDHVMLHDRRVARLTGQPFSDAYFEGLLRELAVDIGLPATDFARASEALAGPATQAHIVTSRQLLAHVGGHGFPTFILAHGTGRLERLDIDTWLGRPPRRLARPSEGADRPIVGGQVDLPTFCRAGSYACRAAATGTDNGVVDRPISADNWRPSSNRAPWEAPTSQPAIAAASPSGSPTPLRAAA